MYADRTINCDGLIIREIYLHTKIIKYAIMLYHTVGINNIVYLDALYCLK